MNPDALIDLALAADELESLPRLGYAMRGVSRPESVAAHVAGVAFWAMLLADATPGADLAHCLRLALLHELGETKLGDIPKIGEVYLPAGAKDAAEAAIVAELLAPLGERGDDYRAFFAEYQEGKTLEARLVRAADKLQMMAKVLRYEMAGHRGVAEFWDYAPNFRDEGLPAARDLFERLRARRPV